MIAQLRKYWPVFFISAFILLPKITFAADWVSIGFADKNIQTTFVSPKNNKKILVGLAGGASNDRNYVTEDGGQTWAPISMSTITNCNQFVINPRLDTEYWAACTNGLYHSTDSGKSFQRIPRYTANILTVVMTQSGRLYITYANNGADYSEDGVIWSDLRVPGEGWQPYLYINSINEKQIFVSKNGSDAPGLYRSNDGGLTWVMVYNISPVRTGVYSMVFLENGTKVCATTAWGYGCSTDFGSTWSSFVSPNPAKPTETEHAFMASQNPDDPVNLIIFTVGWTGTDPKIYSYENVSTLPKVFDGVKLTSSIAVSQGVTYSWAQNSTWQKGLWRNDGIVVVPEYLKKHPVIIVPGILGSWFVPSSGTWELDPILGTYDSLYYSLVDSGLVPGKDIFKFPYQWRNDNKNTAMQLSQVINEIKSETGAKKVDIIAHSMGGIVTRMYAQSDYYNNDINRIFFLGTPQQGSAEAFPLWTAGSTKYDEAYFSMLLSFVLKEESVTNGYLGPNGVLNYIQDKILSIKQLIPVFPYLKLNGNSIEGPVNQDLELLNDAKDIISKRGISVVNIVGDAGPVTVSNYLLRTSNSLPLWQYGEPVGIAENNIYSGVGFSHGDGTVTTGSQEYIQGKSYVLDDVMHSNIPKESVSIILDELGLKGSPRITESINKILMIKAYSPVDFYVTAPDGKRIGFNKSGPNFDEIDGAFYNGNETSSEFITLINPLAGSYSITATGTDEGGYVLEATIINVAEDTTITAQHSGQAVLGKVDTLPLLLSADTKSISMVNADDKNEPHEEGVTIVDTSHQPLTPVESNSGISKAVIEAGNIMETATHAIMEQEVLGSTSALVADHTKNQVVGALVFLLGLVTVFVVASVTTKKSS